MSVASALSCVKSASVVHRSQTRSLSGGGSLSQSTNVTTTLTAKPITRDMKEVETSDKGTVIVDQIELYFKGQQTISEEDEIDFESNTYTVFSERFRRNGGFHKVIIRRIVRKGVV